MNLKAAIFVAAIIACGIAGANPVLWVGGGADKSWTTAENWEPVGVPTSSDDVGFAATGMVKRSGNNIPSVNVLISEAQTIHSLMLTNLCTSGEYWHHMKIDSGAKLRVEGASESGYSLRMQMVAPSNKKYENNVRVSGGGALEVIGGEDSVFGLEASSPNGRGMSKLYCSDLGAFSADVGIFRVGWGDRSVSELELPKSPTADKPNLIRAQVIGVGDSNNEDDTYGNGSYSTIVLGADNELLADRIFVGAPCGLATNLNANCGRIYYNAGVAAGKGRLKIRAHDGEGAADLVIGGNGGSSQKMTIRGVTAKMDVGGSPIDAKIGALTLADGRGGINGSTKASLSASLEMGSGVMTVETLTNGVVRSKSDGRANACTGRISVSGGDFSVSGDSILALGDGGSQSVCSKFVLSGGSATFGGDVVMAEHNNSSSNVTSTVTVSNGTMTVLGKLASGNLGSATVKIDSKDHPATVRADVEALGGVLAVTNAAGTAEFRIEEGTLTLGGGKVLADSLVLTNALSEVAFELSEDGPQVVKVGALKLGGRLTVKLADGYDPRAGNVWPVVSGCGLREGVFSSVDIAQPSGARLLVRYTDSGFQLETMGSGLSLFIR